MIENNSDNTQIKNADEMMYEAGFEKMMNILMKTKCCITALLKMTVG